MASEWERLLTVWDALNNHPELFQYATIVGLFGGAGCALVYLVLRKKFRGHEHLKLTWHPAFVFVAAFAVLFFLALIDRTGEFIAMGEWDLSGRQRIAYVMNYEWATIPAIGIGVLLYWLRGTHRFLYGVLEVIVGSIGIWAALHLEGPVLQQSIVLPAPSEHGLWLTKALTLATGMYVLIRGLDNMAQKLPLWLHKAWDTLFPGGRKVPCEGRLEATNATERSGLGDAGARAD